KAQAARAERQARRASSFTGTVVDSAQRPLSGAAITVPDAEKGGISDNAGHFSVGDIPPGAHHVLVRHVGYGPLDTTLTFAEGATDLRVLLSRVTSLDSVLVKAAPRDQVMREFEENRKLGLGHFYTREQLSKVEGQNLSA